MGRDVGGAQGRGNFNAQINGSGGCLRLMPGWVPARRHRRDAEGYAYVT